MNSEDSILANDFFLHEIANPKISVPNKPVPKIPVKVELQTLYLNETSQKGIMETLKYIHGPSFTLSDASTYKDKRSNLGNQFWIERGNLVVRGGCDYSQDNRTEQTVEDKFRLYAVMKLENYGFYKSHCIEALNITTGETEKALKLLYEKYFNLDTDMVSQPDQNISKEELIEQRNDEKGVLESIYGDVFEEKITNSVWNLNFNLVYLVNMYSNKKVPIRVNKNSNNNNKKTDKCRNFLKGSCRFGVKCRYSHEVQVPEKVSKDFTENYLFTLEIRFPDNSMYPYEPPIILLTTNFPSIPKLICLHICKLLINEAINYAKDGIVSVYSLCELLNNEDEIKNYLNTTKVRFIDESEMLFPVEEKSRSSLLKKLPSHYTRGATYKDGKSQISIDQLSKEDDNISNKFFDKQNNPKYQKFLETRRQLPAWKQMQDILSAVQKSQVVVISGETGCGKSTQVPQFLLDNWLLNRKDSKSHIEIICTQPRRLSAIGVAERVAEERIENVGNTVGYQIRLETKVSVSTRLTFCTTGILLRRLESDPQLNSVSHIIVDEVHERSEESDFLLLILRDLLPLRPDLKVILMSATMNAKLFSEYFGRVPMLEIPGRTFPVEQIFLEDILETTNFILEENSQFARRVKQLNDNLELELESSEIVAANNIPKPNIRDENLTIAQIMARYQGYSRRTYKNLYLMDPEKINIDLIESVLMWIVFGEHDYPREGSILVFLPGISEISSLHDQLRDHPEFGIRNNKFVLVPLHSTLTSEEQSAVFRKPKNGVRKIVLSTNIAETSITIDDCVFVIDCGKMKEKRFDSNRNMESLELVWVSRANALQRKGRAGRVMPGVCIHLFTSHRFDNHFISQPVPELHRVPLEQLLLRIRILPNFEDKSVHQVLAKTIEPPVVENINSAITRLQDVGALDHELNLTPLGHHLAALPVDVRIGKLMLFGAIFCCVDASLTMAACLSYKSPFVVPFSQKKQADAKKRDFAIANSDQLTVLKAYKKWREVSSRSTAGAFAFAQENYLSGKTLLTLSDIKHQLLELLVSIGFVPCDLRIPRRTGQDKVLTITGPQMNANGDNNRLLAAILCAALYPNVIKVLTPEKSFHMSITGAIPRQPKPEELKFKTKQDGYVHLHPSSVNATIGHFASPYLVYQEKIKTSRVFVRDTCMVPILPLALFSGCELVIERHSGVSVLSLEDGWIMFQTETHEIAEMVKTIRLELIKLLEEKIKDPCLNLLHHDEGKKIISTIVQIVSSN